MKTAISLIFLLMLLAPATQAPAQQSDYNIQQSFDQRYNDLRVRIDSASTVAELDSLSRRVDAFAQKFQGNREFLDKALYPDTYDGRISNLRHLLGVAHDRTSTIQAQGVRIDELPVDPAGKRSRMGDVIRQA